MFLKVIIFTSFYGDKNPWLGASGRHRPCCNVSDPIEKIENKYLSEKLHFRIFCWRLTELALVLARCIADNEVLSFHPPPECRDNNQPSTEYSQMQFFWKVLIYTNSNYPAFGHCSQKILNVFLCVVANKEILIMQTLHKKI